ncbi:hypothetical protein RF11_05832 [Thelohanellus kitauei]|uniref:Uncharacterized protein n=1 Tax=Thelohanellus kitauei TaxID=669202 RepID=A0A0C2I7F1_THEKT|nr:hypothetical protein RF11_05832 [Thelohanellus kitauei]
MFSGLIIRESSRNTINVRSFVDVIHKIDDSPRFRFLNRSGRIEATRKSKISATPASKTLHHDMERVLKKKHLHLMSRYKRLKYEKMVRDTFKPLCKAVCIDQNDPAALGDVIKFDQHLKDVSSLFHDIREVMIYCNDVQKIPCMSEAISREILLVNKSSFYFKVFVISLALNIIGLFAFRYRIWSYVVRVTGLRKTISKY